MRGHTFRSLDVRAQTRKHLVLDALERVRAGIFDAVPVLYAGHLSQDERLAVIPETKTCVDCGGDRVRQTEI